jgi:hypothetical protein
VAGGWFWWRATPPRTVRLLPEADGYFYINVAALRTAGAFNKLPEVSEEPEYQDFINATGFRFERDLDSVAFARHGEMEGSQDVRYSEVFAGRIDRGRATNWLKQHAAQTANYRGHDIFIIALQGRSVRIAFLDDGTLAASNAPTEEPIHQIIDRYHQSFPTKTALMAQHYREVPLGSEAWAIARYAEQPARRNNAILSNSLRKLLAGTTLVGSARYLPSTSSGTVELRTEAIATSEDQARRIADGANTFLQIYRAAEIQLKAPGGDADVKAALNSLHVEQDGKRTAIVAELPARLLQKLATEAK